MLDDVLINKEPLVFDGNIIPAGQTFLKYRHIEYYIIPHPDYMFNFTIQFIEGNADKLRPKVEADYERIKDFSDFGFVLIRDSNRIYHKVNTN